MAEKQNKDIKICLPRRSFTLTQAVAYLLKEKYGIEKFYDHCCPRKDKKFFQGRKDIQFSALFINEDLHEKAKKAEIDLNYIKFIEKEYGFPNLWPLVYMDRSLIMNYPKSQYSYGVPACSHEEMLKFLQIGFQEISKALERTRPDFIIFFAMGGINSYIVYQVAKKMGIRIVFVDMIRIKNKVILVDNCYDIFPKVNQIFDDLCRGSRRSAFLDEANTFLKEFRERPFSHLYWLPPEPPSFFDNFLRASRYFWRSRSKFLYFQKHLIKSLRKLCGLKSLCEQPQESEDFALFPLHVEPETATMLLAPFYTNQIALIQNIAKSLPVHFKLYVKEHPDMVYYRPFSYYKELKKIPNVRLINPRADIISLIMRAKIILTITGTTGWEAVLLKKPVITFGSVFYNKLPMVTRCYNIEELPKIVKEKLENYQYKEEELVNFLSAIFECSIPLDYNYYWGEISCEEMIKNEEFKKFVDFLAKELDLT